MRPLPVILCYHEIGDTIEPSFRRFTLTRAEFRRQMAWLASAGYESVSLTDLVTARARCGALPRRSVIITFDDGFESCARHAPQILGEFGFTATFFLVAGLVGGRSSWTELRRGFALPLLDWRRARDLETAGFACASHSVSHGCMTELDDESCFRELADSKRMLEDALGHAVQHFAFPYGAYDQRILSLARLAGYQTAVTTDPGLLHPEGDLLALPRVVVKGDRSFVSFVSSVQTGWALGEQPRRWDAAVAAVHAAASSLLPLLML